MSQVKTPAVRVLPVAGAAGNGYALSHHDGVTANFCAVAVLDGKLRVARWSEADKEASGPERIERELANTDARGDVPWAFAMAGAAPIEPLMDALGMPHEGRSVAAAEVAETVSSQLASLGGLDRRGLDALAASPARRPGALAFYSGEGERAERRRQAAASYPILADVISANLTAKMAVDRGRPLAEALAGILGGMASGNVGKAVVKRLASAPSLPAGCDLDTVVRFMTLVPADWVPQAGSEWSAFCHVAHALLEDLAADAADIPSLTKGCGGKWTEFCARVVRKAGMDETDVLWGVRRAMFNAADMLNAFSEAAVLPMAAHAGSSAHVTVTPEMMMGAARSAFAMLASGRTAGDLADLQRRWHQESAAILGATRQAHEERAARIRGEVEEGGWPALTRAVQAPNGLWLVPLTNPAELKDEGSESKDANGVSGLHHCVGGYDSKAKKCDCHIVSVRRLDERGRYTRVTTVEFAALSPEHDKLTVRQNLGLRNGKAPPESVDAVNWYIASVASGTINLNREQIAAFLNEEIVPDDGVERICGYDWRGRDILNAAVGPWGPFVAQGFRKPLDTLLAMDEITGIAGMIFPEILLAGR